MTGLSCMCVIASIGWVYWWVSMTYHLAVNTRVDTRAAAAIILAHGTLTAISVAFLLGAW